MPPRGMSERSVALSTGPDGLAAEHGLAEVRAVVDREKGDGWIVKDWPSRHAQGKFLQWRKRETKLGVKHHYEIISVDSVLLAVDQVQESVTAEVQRIDGAPSENGTRIGGELDDLAYSRAILTQWPDATATDKQDIQDSFTDMAEVRDRAINPLNIAVGTRAAKMPKLKNNPSAMLATMVPMERDLTDRFTKLVTEVMPTNAARRSRYLQWLRQETSAVTRASNALDRLITSGSQDDLYPVILAVKEGDGVRFRVQPFNHLAYEIQQTGWRIEDVTVAQTAKNGIEFQAQHNYFALPFRLVLAMNQAELQATISNNGEELLAVFEERIANMAELRPGGAYNLLVSRLEQTAHSVTHGIHAQDPGAIQKAAKQSSWLLTYHCLAGEEEQAKPWYRYFL